MYGENVNAKEPKLDRRSVLGLTGAAIDASAASIAGSASAQTQRSDIVMLDAVALSNAIHTRRVSCVEVMTAYLDHIERVNPKVNAIVALEDRGGLIAQATERDAQLAHGESMGSLHGFPHAVKDLQFVKGILSTQGSPILKDFIPSADSLMVERLRRAGAIIIGKTNVPEFGLGSHTYNPVYGLTRNAYDQTRSAGGSSGGAAVSLALRMLPVADGSDYVGSLRNPAGWNNVVGFRTSIGRVPNDALDVWLPSIGVTGPMARNISDLSLLLSVQAGYDARAPLSMEGNGAAFQGSLEASFRGKRIAWAGDFKGYTPYEPGVLDVCQSALKVFASIGCAVDEAQPDYRFDAVWQAVLRIRGWQQGGALLGFTMTRQNGLCSSRRPSTKSSLGLNSQPMTSPRRPWSGPSGIRLCAACSRVMTTSSCRRRSSSHSTPKSIGHRRSQAKKWKPTTSG